MRTLWYFFRKAPERAGRSAWYDRRVRNAEAAGSNPARSIKRTGLNWIDLQRIYWQRKVRVMRPLLASIGSFFFISAANPFFLYFLFGFLF